MANSLKIIIFFIAILSNNSFSDDIQITFFPNSNKQVDLSASVNGDTLTTPATKENNSCFNTVFNNARRGFSGLIDAQLDDGKQTKFRAGFIRNGKNRLRVLYEEKENGTIGHSWIDPTSKESKTGTKIDVQDDNIE